MKKNILFLVLGLLIATTTIITASSLDLLSNPFPILINDIITDIDGYNINGSTYLKLADFRKAGLTIKFNEINKRIEITTMEGMKKMEEANINDFKIHVMDNIEYICGKDINDKYQDYTFSTGKDINNNKIFNFTIKEDKKTIIKNVPYVVKEGRTYIAKDYFTENVLPLIIE